MSDEGANLPFRSVFWCDSLPCGMEKVILTPGGLQVSPLVAGVMKWGVWGADLDRSAMQSLVKEAAEIGFTTIDHADIYGNYTTEAAFGAAIADLGSGFRDQLQLISKCGIRLVTKNRPDNRLKAYLTSKEYIIQSVETSLQNLRTDYLDLLLIHRPDLLMEPHEVSAAVAELKTSGLFAALKPEVILKGSARPNTRSVPTECQNHDQQP